VDIFDTSTQQWSQAKLSVARFNTAMTTAGAKVLIAGGSTLTMDALDIVDIWNAQTNTWTTAKLSAPRALIGGASTCDGNLAIFAGGGDADWDTRFLTTSSSRVDLYNAATDQWSQSQLSQARTAAFAASDGQHFFLGGGWNPETQTFLRTAEFFSCPTSGLSEQKNLLPFALYPNPSGDEFWLNFGSTVPLTINVYDLFGRQMATINPDSGDVKVNLQELPAGQYIISAVTKEGNTGWKLWIKAL
jgi:N-acetylneuraminic acid mutarotase